ncbi:MAG: hypothetical protein ACRC2R_19965 [Xenococcaceae cyanobacterium]
MSRSIAIERQKIELMQSINIFNEVSPQLADRLRAMPKAEIHVHIEGATSAETYYQIAQKNKIDLPVSSLEEWQSFFQFRNFAHFIEVYVFFNRKI